MILVSDGSDNVAIDVTDAGYTTALSIADNSIVGTTPVIDFTNFDVSNLGGISVAAGQGLDTNAAGQLVLGGLSATSIALCNSAACDTINIGTNADADVINIGDDLDSLVIEAVTDFNSAVNFASGGATFSSGEFLFTAGNVQMNDNVVLQLGSGAEFEMVHDGANTSFTNTVGDLTFNNSSGALTLDSTAAGDVIMMDLSAGGTFLVKAEVGTDLFRVNDDESGVEIPVGDLSLSDGIIVGSGSDRFEIGNIDATFALGRNDAGNVTLTAEDNDADADFTIEAGGTGLLSLRGGVGSEIDFAEFDVGSGNGSVTIDDDLDAGSLEVEGTILDINSLDFLGAGTVQSQAGDLSVTAADDLILKATDGVSIVGASTEFSGDLTVSGGDISGLAMSGTNIDMGESTAGAITFDAGANGFIFNTDADSSLVFDSTTDATDIDITTAANESLVISPNGTGDLVFVADADTSLLFPTAGLDGTPVLQITSGNLVLSDGDFISSGGDFDVTLDAADQASFTSTATTVAGGMMTLNTTTAGTHADNIASLGLNLTLTDYADDGVADNRNGLVITVTNNASDAGVDDNISAIRIQNLGGVNQGDGSENAIRIGTGWDADILLGNNETISNQQTNGTISFLGVGGAGTNTQLNLDLDGTANVPTLSGAAGTDVVAVNDGLSIGVDGISTHSISSGFALSGGNDLYVQDQLGVNGAAYFDSSVNFLGVTSVGTTENAITGTQPAVNTGNYFRLTQGGSTTVEDFTSGTTGQVIFVRIGDAFTTFDCNNSSGGADSLNCGATNITTESEDFMVWFKDAPGTWNLVSLMDASDNHNAGSGFDLAEWFPSSQELVPGEVVSVDVSGPGYVKASEGAYDSTVLGIVSTEPGITLGEPADVSAAKIALAGRVPVNVNNENGSIVPGDYLTTSSTPGEAMKATEAGPVIGVALESFDDASGQVLVKVTNFWYSPSSSSSNALQDAVGTDGLDGVEVVVEGDAVFEGSVTVRDHLYAGSDTAGRARIVAGDTKVHVAFETSYAQQPIVTATLRTATDIPGYWWVENESTVGFDLWLDGTLTTDVEFNWIALGVENGKVTVSDGSIEDINVYVLSEGELASPSSSSSSGSGSGNVTSEEPVAEESVEIPVEEPAGEESVEEEPVESAAEPEPEPAPEEEPASEPIEEEAAAE
jgi:hypothetical protein